MSFSVNSSSFSSRNSLLASCTCSVFSNCCNNCSKSPSAAIIFSDSSKSIKIYVIRLFISISAAKVLKKSEKYLFCFPFCITCTDFPAFLSHLPLTLKNEASRACFIVIPGTIEAIHRVNFYARTFKLLSHADHLLFLAILIYDY